MAAAKIGGYERRSFEVWSQKFSENASTAAPGDALLCLPLWSRLYPDQTGFLNPSDSATCIEDRIITTSTTAFESSVTTRKKSVFTQFMAKGLEGTSYKAAIVKDATSVLWQPPMCFGSRGSLASSRLGSYTDHIVPRLQRAIPLSILPPLLAWTAWVLLALVLAIRREVTSLCRGTCSGLRTCRSCE